MTSQLIEADAMVLAFNATTERNYWHAKLSSTARVPHVIFSSRSAMLELRYFPDGRFLLAFQKTSCAFGDFMMSVHKSIQQIMQAMKASGLPVACPLDDGDGVVRLEFNPVTKEVWAHVALTSDNWQETEGFKVLGS